MNCRKFSEYVFFCLPTSEADLLPAEALDHLETCSRCQAKVGELTTAFKLLRKKEKRLARQAKKSLARVLARVQDRLRRGDLGEPSEDKDVDCQKIQPFLRLAADPLGEMFPSSWMEEHFALCKDCEQEFNSLEEFRNTVIMTEMLASNRDVTIDNVFPDVKPSVAKQIHRLVNIKPADITCEQVSRYYHDMAICNFEPSVPGEIYLHTRSCVACEEWVKQLRSELSVAIPQSGSPEFAALLRRKG